MPLGGGLSPRVAHAATLLTRGYATWLVTDPFHTRRTRLCFQEAFRDTGITLSVRPVEGSSYDPEAWWLSTGSIRLTWTEYTKLALHLVGYR